MMEQMRKKFQEMNTDLDDGFSAAGPYIYILVYLTLIIYIHNLDSSLSRQGTFSPSTQLLPLPVSKSVKVKQTGNLIKL